jgi:hypothetical protein
MDEVIASLNRHTDTGGRHVLRDRMIRRYEQKTTRPNDTQSFARTAVGKGER